MVRAYIPKYKLIEYGGGRNYYVYILEISYAAKIHTIEKRYSAFHRIYKEIEKNYISGSFPPKRIRNTTHKVLELRRAGLEQWLQSILKIQPIPKCIINFLEIQNYKPTNILSGLETKDNKDISHRPMLVCSKDPFLNQSYFMDFSHLHFPSFNSNNVASMVTRGVLLALYDQNLKIDLVDMQEQRESLMVMAHKETIPYEKGGKLNYLGTYTM